MRLREWAGRAWSAPGVETACLDLQDAQAQNVALLLWASWAARTGRTPDADEISAACDTARVWQDTVIAPLRSIRRGLRTRVPDLDEGDRVAIRSQVKKVELDAELRLLDALEALSAPPAGEARATLPALISVAREWSTTTPRVALTLLAERLPE